MKKIKSGSNEKLYLGNIYSKRDWGHAEDYVEAMWQMLQNKTADDFVIATGKQYTVKEFIKFVSNKLKMKILWKGKGLKEKCYWNKKIIIEIDKNYFRPTEVESLRGDYRKAKKILGWRPKNDINSLIDKMLNNK